MERADRDRLVHRWHECKKHPVPTTDFEIAQGSVPEQISLTNFMMVASQMADQGLAGLPYVDVRTFNGWRAAGQRVKRGEKSSLWSITWIPANGNGSKPENGEAVEADTSRRMWPKLTALFHISQVEAIS